MPRATANFSPPGFTPAALERLELLVNDIQAVQSKLILLIGLPGAGKTALLRGLAARRGVGILTIGAVLGALLAPLPVKQRGLEANHLLRNLADKYASGEVLLLDNLELLFDQTLRLDPLDLLKRHAHARRIVAVWPGDLRQDRLTHAVLGHPEYKEYGLEGYVPFALTRGERE